MTSQALLLGDLVLEAIAGFSFGLLVLGPVVVSVLAFGAWVLSAPSAAVRWSEEWVGTGINLCTGLWVLNLIAQGGALWAYLSGNVSLIPPPLLERSTPLLVLNLVGPGVILSSICLSIARARVGGPTE